MNRFVLIALLAIGVGGYHFYKTADKPEPVTVGPLYDRSYISVYGRDSCGNTQYMLRQLNETSAYYIYEDIDDRAVADLIHKRMRESGIDTSHYMLPVIDVNGKIFVNPEPQQVMSIYNSGKS